MTYLPRGRVTRFLVWVAVYLLPCDCAIAQGKETASSPASANQVHIVTNQIGYLPRWPKVVMLLGDENVQTHTAQLVNADNSQSVLTITPGRVMTDPQTGDSLRVLDFSAVTTPGRYYIHYQDSRSSTFRIGDDVYREPLRLMLRSYYLQRCGVAINDDETQVRHAACHLQDGVLAHADVTGARGTSYPAVGGWHDAGDYGKYVATAAVTIGRLLNLYELYPSQFPDRQLNIPESGNGVSDLLDEVRIEMTWLLSLQRKDGAVYRKVSGMNWPKKVTPDQDDQPRFVFGVSTPETAKFAAVAAMSARVYQASDPAYSQACLSAARRAWSYLEQHPTMQVDWVESDDQGSGKYLYSEVDQEEALLTDADDRLWAAVELFATTKDEQFQRYVRTQVPNFSFTLFEWKDPSPLALVTYYRLDSTGRSDRRNAHHIQAQIVKRADQILKTIRQSGYRIATDRFVWGSNKMAAEEGITLVHAYQITGNPLYWRGALDQVDYLLGRNHFGMSFVASLGERSVQHVCHIPSRVTGIAVLGLLVGGPNAAAQCGIAPKGRGPLSYVDHEESYATNENAIDYNASAIALIAMVVSEDERQRTTSFTKGVEHGKCCASR